MITTNANKNANIAHQRKPKPNIQHSIYKQQEEIKLKMTEQKVTFQEANKQIREDNPIAVLVQNNNKKPMQT